MNRSTPSPHVTATLDRIAGLEQPPLEKAEALVDVATGTTRVVEDGELMSFIWSPCSRRLVSMAFEERSGMRWQVIDVYDDSRALGEPFYPSRELVYFCWFFDQFASSHPLISPDGTHLAFAGHMPDRLSGETAASVAEAGDAAGSSVYVAPLAGGAPAERVARGHFACWDARLRGSSPGV